MPPSKSKFYAVARGRQVGIFLNWPECQKQVNGFPRARYKSFKTRDEAAAFIKTESSGNVVGSAASSNSNNHGSRKRSASTENNNNATTTTSATATRKKQKTTSAHTGTSSCSTGLPLSSKSKVKIHIMFDGGSRGNPGLAGSGAFVTTTAWDDTKSTSSATATRVAERFVVKVRHYVGDKSTNNEAEYDGLCSGLDVALEQVQDLISKKSNQQTFRLQLIVEGDSQLIIRQLTGRYACKNVKLKPMFSAAQDYLQEIRNAVLQSNHNDPKSIQVQYQHVLREGNKVADGLANEAMDAGRSWYTTSDDDHEDQHTLIPWTDAK